MVANLPVEIIPLRVDHVPLAHPFLKNLYKRFVDAAPESFKAILAAGCEVKYEMVKNGESYELVATTVNPVATAQCPHTGTWHVFERKSG